jgi:hypothetical protein
MLSTTRATQVAHVIALSITFAALACQSSSAQTVVGGITPSQRPKDAPRIEKVNHDDAWRERALKGVSKPYPPSLNFLADQGDWYTPFTRPGMPGYYDIRQLHARKR